jgi:subtilisin family serine protease
VASILGGEKFGVAPAVRIHALRILPCGGTTRTDRAATVRAVDWITAHGQKPAVVNLSPARWETTERDLDEAIQRSIAAGFVYVVSAGGATDLRAHTPQRIAEAIVVGATAADDRAMSHEYGPSLTLFAPGVGIEAAGNASDSATFVGEGDSYAAPFVAGVVALYLEHHPSATPSTIKQLLVDQATRDVVVGAGSSPNLLLHIIR